MNKKIIISAVILIFAVAGLLVFGFSSKSHSPLAQYGISEVTIYKSPNCGCCTRYSAYLEKQGIDVDLVTTRDMMSIKGKYDIPDKLYSCHTSLVGDYIVEGHVPLDFIDRMISEKFDVDGIALPGMPAGSPGMPGPKPSSFEVYSFKSGDYQPLTLN